MTRSESEERFLELVRKADLPRPEVNARIGRFEVDFCWRRERLIVEIDGYSFTRAKLRSNAIIVATLSFSRWGSSLSGSWRAN